MEEQNPFGDQHEAGRAEDGLHARPASQFGLPPLNVGRENIPPGDYRPGYQPSSSYSNVQSAVAGSKATRDDYAEDGGDEEELIRKPVQYRF